MNNLKGTPKLSSIGRGGNSLRSFFKRIDLIAVAVFCLSGACLYLAVWVMILMGGSR